MSKPRLLVLSDSLALPRLQPEICFFEKTWPSLLRANFEVHQVSLGGATLPELARQIEYYICFSPDIVVLQSGIVDCAPRALSRFETEVLKRMWWFGWPISYAIKKHKVKIRSLRHLSYTSPQRFTECLEKIRQRLGNTRFIGIQIIPASIEYERQVPGIARRVNQYNEILSRFFQHQLVKLDDLPTSAVMSDHIHINSEGHQLVYQKLLKTLGADD